MKHNFEETNNGIISSDDPNALAKLRDKLAKLEAWQESMKAANKIFKSAKLSTPQKTTALQEMGMTDDQIRKLAGGDFSGRIGYPSYKLTNNNGNMASIRDRIKRLEKLEGLETSEVSVGDVRIVTNAEANRLQFIFPGKPGEAIRAELKSHGFHWSPTENAWQRMLPVSDWTIRRITDLIAPPKKEADIVCPDPAELAQDDFMSHSHPAHY